MATTEEFKNGGATSYSFSIEYIKASDIKVKVDGVAQTYTTNASPSSGQYKVVSTTLTLGATAASGTGNVHIFRETDLDTAAAVFAAGSSIRAADLNACHDLVRLSSQEQNQTIRTADFGDGQVTSAKIADGTIVNADVNASAAIAGTKISPNFGSQNIVTSGTVDGRDVSADGTKLDGIEASATADQTNAEIRAAVEAASDSNVFTDADHSKLNAIEASATADQTNAEIRTAVEAASDSNVFTDADHSKLNAIEANATADQTASEIKSLIASSPLDASHLAADSVTTSEIADAELTTLAGMQTGTASILAGGTALTATLAEINTVVDGKSVETTISDTDAAYPTSGAVVDYVAAQIAPIGGLEVIATDAAFPNVQPSAGVVISIADAGGLVVNGSGTSTTGRTVGASTVTINNIASNFNSTTVDAGVAMMVSSTGSGQIYNYHKATLKEADLLSLSNDINDFANRYRVVSGEPGSNNDEGDLIYDTAADKMKVYDSSTSAFKEVTSTGDFKYLFLCPAGGTGAPTLNGSIATYDLRETTNSGSAASVTSAAQLLVSINGVVQKANTGTSAPAEGFALVDANTIIFGANLASGDSVFIVQFGSALTITTPGDNTVATAKLQNLSVTTAKIAADAVDGTKLADNACDSEHYTDGSIDHVHLAGDAVDGDNIADDSINSEHYVDGSIDTAHIADDQVTLAKMAGIARGKIIYGDASGNPAVLAPGTSGQVLESDGTDISWQNAAAGATGGNSNANGVFWENQQTVTHDYTIQNNYNAGSFGPITINSGITVTVGAGESWTVI